MSAREEALAILLNPDPAIKADAARHLYARLGGDAIQAVAAGNAAVPDVPGLSADDCAAPLRLTAAQQAAMPGRPGRPRLVPAKPGALALALHAGAPRGAAACGLPHRVQRDQ